VNGLRLRGHYQLRYVNLIMPLRSLVNCHRNLAVRVRIKSRSTSARPPSTASIKRPVLLVLSAHGSATERNCALASTICLTMANKSKVLWARGQSASPSPHRRGQLAEHPVKLPPVGPRAGHLLAVDVPARASGFAKLLKLAVEGLPHGADAGIADKAFFRVSFGHILRQL
jgi:hypothetical protein